MQNLINNEYPPSNDHRDLRDTEVQDTPECKVADVAMQSAQRQQSDSEADETEERNALASAIRAGSQADIEKDDARQRHHALVTDQHDASYIRLLRRAAMMQADRGKSWYLSRLAIILLTWILLAIFAMGIYWFIASRF